MTYGVGMMLNRGLVFKSDTRTNAGFDNVSTFRKMRVWEKPGAQILTLLSLGNLATTRAVVSRLEERTKSPEDRANLKVASDGRHEAEDTALQSISQT